MDQAQQDIFAKLEAAIDKWSAEVTEAQSDLAREVARARDLAKAGPSSAGEEGAVTQGAIPAGSLESLVELFRESFETLREDEARLSRWEETAARIHSEVETLKEALNRPAQPDPRLMERLEELHTQVGRIEERSPAGLELEEERRLAGQVENLRAELGMLREIVAGTPELDQGVSEELRGLRGELVQIRENTDRVTQLESRIEALSNLFKSTLAQLEHHPQTAPAGTSPPETEREGAPAEEETVEVGAEEDLSADLESFEGPVAVVEEEDRAESEGEGQAEGSGSPRLEAFGPDGSRRRLGEILVAAGVVTQDQLDRALAAQENHPQKHLGALLIEMGLTGEDVIAQTLACQVGLRYIRLDPEQVDQNAARLIPSRMALRHKCLGVRVEGDRIDVAMANPLDLIAIEDVERATNKNVEPLVASNADIMSALEWCYGSSGSEI